MAPDNHSDNPEEGHSRSLDTTLVLGFPPYRRQPRDCQRSSGGNMVHGCHGHASLDHTRTVVLALAETFAVAFALAQNTFVVVSALAENTFAVVSALVENTFVAVFAVENTSALVESTLVVFAVVSAVENTFAVESALVEHTFVVVSAAENIVVVVMPEMTVLLGRTQEDGSRQPKS